jgi:hypothetical protein
MDDIAAAHATPAYVACAYSGRAKSSGRPQLYAMHGFKQVFRKFCADFTVASSSINVDGGT